MSRSKLEDALYEAMRLQSMTEQGFPMPERELHPLWCCEHKKNAHDNPRYCAPPLECGACEGEAAVHEYEKPRDWRCDFVWPSLRLIVEVEGGVWTQGRHTRGSGFTKDTIKYNALVNAGWNLQRFTGEQVRSGEALNRICQVISELEESRP